MMRIQIVVHTLMMTGMCCASVAADRNADDAFQIRLDQLRSQHVSFERTRTLARDYEQLLADYPQHKQRGAAMFELARLYDGFRNEEQIPIGNSHEEAIKWFRLTRADPRVDRQVWIDATFDLARCLRDREDDASVHESRVLLEDLAKQHGEKFSISVRVKAELVSQYVAAGEIEAADDLCRELLRDEGKPATHSLSRQENSQLESNQLSAAVTVMQAMLFRTDMGKAQKEAWLEDFAAVAKDHPMLAENIKFYEGRLASLDLMVPDVVPPQSTVSSTRKYMLIANVAAILVLGVIAVQRRRARATAMES